MFSGFVADTSYSVTLIPPSWAGAPETVIADGALIAPKSIEIGLAFRYSDAVSLIVNTAVLIPSVAPDGLERARLIVSFASEVLSPQSPTLTVFDPSPAPKLTL